MDAPGSNIHGLSGKCLASLFLKCLVIVISAVSLCNQLQSLLFLSLECFPHSPRPT